MTFTIVERTDGWYFVEHVGRRRLRTGSYPSRLEAAIRAAWELGRRGLPLAELSR